MAFEPTFQPRVTAIRIAESIEIDGVLDEPGWRQAGLASGFSETDPGDQIAPAVRSQALVMYDATNLYIALIAYDDPTSIRAGLHTRDNIWSDDYFGVMIDPNGDQSFGYGLFVNPFGLQGDESYQNGGGSDGSYDVIFFSDGMITDSGYQVELAIPFASLRFPEGQQDWRINFWRDRKRDNRYRYTWAAQDRDEGCFMCQWGHLDGIEGIERSSNIEILPTFVASQAGLLTDITDTSEVFDNDDPEADVSMNIKYGLSNNAGAELTYNPDFSQVESDAGRIDVNTTFGLFFPERRPFFQEGSDLFNTWISQVYTRTINDPQFAGKLSGTFGDASVNILAAFDENSTFLIPGPERSYTAQSDEALVGIARYRQQLANQVYIGWTFTARSTRDFSLEGMPNQMQGGLGATYSFDSRVRLTKNWQVEFQAVGSYIEEPQTLSEITVTTDSGDVLDTIGLVGTSDRFDNGRYSVEFDGESFSGHSVYASLERSGRIWNFDIDYRETSPTFRAENGFVTSNDSRLVSMWTGLNFRPNGALIKQIEPSVSTGRVWDFDSFLDANPLRFRGGSKDEWLRPSLFVRFSGQTSFFVQYLNSRERFGVNGEVFPGISRLYSELSRNFSRTFEMFVYTTFGNTIWRDRSEPELARFWEGGAGITFRPTSRLVVNPRLDYVRLSRRPSVAEALGTERIELAETYILRTRTTYQFSREWGARLIVQWNENNNRVNVEPLLTWQLNPLTVFYLGANWSLRDYDVALASAPSQERTRFARSSQQLYLKFQYLFRV